MSLDRWSAVERYFEDLLFPADPVLEAALAESVAAGLPAINVSAAQGRLLYLLAQLVGAQRILEIGTLGGYSAIWLARALSARGRLVTIELNPEHAEVARHNIGRARLADRVDLRVGPALKVLPELEAEHAGPFDLVFVDADKPHYREYLSWAIRLARPGSLIVVDNVVRDGAVIDETTADPSIEGVRHFNAALKAERRVTATAIQTVGAKGHDGFAIMLVRET